MTFTVVTGDAELLLIKNLCGGHKKPPHSFMFKCCRLNYKTFHCSSIKSSFSTSSTFFPPFSLNTMNRNGHMSRQNKTQASRRPATHTLTLPLPTPITRKDLVFRAHYFLLLSHTLSKAMLSLLRLESRCQSGKAGNAVITRVVKLRQRAEECKMGTGILRV